MGTHQISVDNRRKVKLPGKWAESVGSGAVLTKGFAGCAVLMPAAIWAAFSQKLLALPMSADPWKRIFIGNADDANLDSRSRLTIPDLISTFIGCTDRIAAVGVGHYLELWEPQRLMDSEAKALREALPPAIADFTF